MGSLVVKICIIGRCCITHKETINGAFIVSRCSSLLKCRTLIDSNMEMGEVRSGIAGRWSQRGLALIVYWCWKPLTLIHPHFTAPCPTKRQIHEILPWGIYVGIGDDIEWQEGVCCQVQQTAQIQHDFSCRSRMLHRLNTDANWDRHSCIGFLGGRRSPAVACWASDHWVASSNPLRGKFRH